jgi:hypothetical protein
VLFGAGVPSVSGTNAAPPVPRAVVVGTVPPQVADFGALSWGEAQLGFIYLGYAAEDRCRVNLAALNTGVVVTGCAAPAPWAVYLWLDPIMYLRYGPCDPAGPSMPGVTLTLGPNNVTCGGRPLWPVDVTGLRPWLADLP